MTSWKQMKTEQEQVDPQKWLEQITGHLNVDGSFVEPRTGDRMALMDEFRKLFKIITLYPRGDVREIEKSVGGLYNQYRGHLKDYDVDGSISVTTDIVVVMQFKKPVARASVTKFMPSGTMVETSEAISLLQRYPLLLTPRKSEAVRASTEPEKDEDPDVDALQEQDEPMSQPRKQPSFRKEK